jgi:hypothetical protein
MKSEMEREMKSMEMGDGLILTVERMTVFWMMMTSTRNTVKDDNAVSITRGGRLVTLAVWLSLAITNGCDYTFTITYGCDYTFTIMYGCDYRFTITYGCD